MLAEESSDFMQCISNHVSHRNQGRRFLQRTMYDIVNKFESIFISIRLVLLIRIEQSHGLESFAVHKQLTDIPQYKPSKLFLL